MIPLDHDLNHIIVSKDGSSMGFSATILVASKSKQDSEGGQQSQDNCGAQLRVAGLCAGPLPVVVLP